MTDPHSAVETDIPARFDRLPWTRFHTLVIAALGITWILDGLEVTVAGSIAGALQASPLLRFSAEEVGLLRSAYLAGAVLGALFFGYLTDRLGRKKLFMVTLGLYLVATALTAASWDLGSFLAFRFLTGAGIGNTRRSTRRSRNCAGAVAGAPISASTAASGRRSSARGAVVGLAGRTAGRYRLARGVRDRRRARLDIGAAPVRAREPALADDPRPHRRGKAIMEGIERRVEETAAPEAAGVAAGAGVEPVDGRDDRGDPASTTPGVSRPCADGGAGVFYNAILPTRWC